MTDLKPTPTQFRAYLLAHGWEHRHNGLNGDEHWWHPATADYMDESYSWPPNDPDPIGSGMIEVIAGKEGRCEHEVLADMLGEIDAATALARVADAITLAFQYGGIGGDHHKAWVIDQMIRILAGDDYERLVDEANDGEDGPNAYTWDEGIAP